MKISNRDLAQISAYLDGELSQRDSNKLETRMEGNPEFQAALEDLKTVKAVLSHTPQLSVPRNFTLKPELVESPQRQSPTRGYRLAAAALSFLFIGVVVLDIGSGVLRGGLSAAQAPKADEVMLEAAVEEMEEAAPLAKEQTVEEEIAPAAEMEEAPPAPEYLATGVEGESAEMEGEATIAVQDEADRASENGEDAVGEESLDLGNELSQDEDTEPEEAWMPPEQEPSPTVDISRIPWLRILEIIFGLGAVGFGAAAWIRHRKIRKG